MSEYRTPSDIHPCLTYADAELSLGAGVVMVRSPRPGRQSPGPAGGYTATLSVYVPDPDQHLAQAVASGARVTQPMRDEEYGARGYNVADLEGHNWYFGNYRPGEYWEGAAGDAHDA